VAQQQFGSLQEAIAESQGGLDDPIVVEQGVFRERINTLGKPVYLKAAIRDPKTQEFLRDPQTGELLPGHPFDHVIATPDNLIGPPLITVPGDRGVKVIIEGFTIVGGWAPEGGGVVVAQEAEAELTRCVLRGNRAEAFGGAVYVLPRANVTLISSVIVDNEADENGGALFVAGSPEAPPRRIAMVGCTVTRNRSQESAVFFGDVADEACLFNNIIFENQAPFDLLNDGPNVQTFNYSLLSDKVQGFECGRGCLLGTKPGFRRTGEGFFRLLPTSPAIDAGFGTPPCLENRLPLKSFKGDSSSDFEGDPAYDDPDTGNTGGGDPEFRDIGADEFLPIFVRADANADGQVDIGDPISVLDYLFGGGAPHTCDDAADSNDVGGKDISDAIYVFQYLFASGPMPPMPFPFPGTDPTPDSLTCAYYGAYP
jgi:hypothetical protein